MVHATAAQAGELADVLVRASGDTIVVADLGTNSFLDEDDAPWPPSRIAAEQGVSCQVHPLGALASGVIGLSDEAIAIRCGDLPRFLDSWSPYDLTLADMPGSPDPARTDEIALAITGKPPSTPWTLASSLARPGRSGCYD
jgi:hypothetical protein